MFSGSSSVTMRLVASRRRRRRASRSTRCRCLIVFARRTISEEGVATIKVSVLATIAGVVLVCFTSILRAQCPDAIAAAGGEAQMVTLHAEGAQIGGRQGPAVGLVR
jgi:hypothetical protein